MRKYPALNRLTAALCTLLIGIACFIPLQTASAARFSQVSLQLDRLKANTALSGTLCAIPSSAGAGTEGKVSVTFPSDFTISSALSNWTTDTDNLPSGSTAWPGISGTPSNISGKTVTFTGSDLTSSVSRYCFNFQASGSTTGSAGNKIGTITTRTAGNATIDQTDISVPIVNNDAITITATVPASPTDFTATITKITPSTLFRENDEVEYEITYGSHLAYNTQVTLEASWSLGTVAGSGIPSVDIAEYVIGSATTGYNGVAPVIDLTNRKITWTYTSFPGTTTDETVRFKLRTTDNYTGQSIVTFDASARVLGPGTATDYSSVTAKYQYSNFQPTPIPGPTSTPTIGPGPTATPTPPPTQAPTFQNIDIRTVTADEGVIDILLSRPASITVTYGLDPTTMTQRLVSLTRSRSHTLRLTDLEKNTPYYFQIVIRDENGLTRRSDIFTFTTAAESIPPKVTLDSLVATGGNTVLFTSLYYSQTDNRNVIVVPTDTVFDMQFGVNADADIREIFLIVRDRNVLGINNIVGELVAASDTTPMVEIKSGVFTGRLQSKATPGIYDIYARVMDANNNMIEEKIAEMKVSKPFIILQERTQAPIENAKVTLSLYNQRTRTYEVISPQKMAIANPAYSEPDGSVPVVLPIGTYRAVVEESRNEKQIVDFTIGPNPGEEYPTVYLKNAPFSLSGTAQRIINTCSDIAHASHDYLMRLGTSGRFLELNMLITLLCFILLSIFALAHRLRVPVHHLPRYFATMLFHHSANSMQKGVFRGRIVDGETDRPIAGADVFLIDSATAQVMIHTTSDKQGKFSFPVLPIFNYSLEITKTQYHEGKFRIHEVAGDVERGFVMVKHGSVLAVKEKARLIVESLFSMSFEALLLASFVLSILLGTTFGFLTVLPFLILAAVNLFLWLTHSRPHTG